MGPARSRWRSRGGPILVYAAGWLLRTTLGVTLLACQGACGAESGHRLDQLTVSLPPEVSLPTLPRFSQPPAAEPALYGSITNVFGPLGPAFETTTTRVADRPHHYAKDSPWNADESLAMLASGAILDGWTYRPTGVNVLQGRTSPNEHRVWSNTDPRIVYGVHAQRRQWIRVDATSAGASSVVATYPDDGAGHRITSLSFGNYEGTLDAGDTGAVLLGADDRGVLRYPFLIDPRTGNVRCAVTGGGGYGGAADNAGISQDGRYLLIQWRNVSIDAYLASDCSFLRRLSHNGRGHYDACVSAGGDQVIVQANGPLEMIRISDGEKTTVYRVDPELNAHLSCRNLSRPGWVFVSVANNLCTRPQDANAAAFHRIFALRLDGSQTAELFAWDHERCPSPYPEMTMAAPSPTGTRVWWKANWDGASSGVHSFVARRN